MVFQEDKISPSLVHHKHNGISGKTLARLLVCSWVTPHITSRTPQNCLTTWHWVTSEDIFISMFRSIWILHTAWVKITLHFNLQLEPILWIMKCTIIHRIGPKWKFKCSLFYICNMQNAYNPKPMHQLQHHFHHNQSYGWRDNPTSELAIWWRQYKTFLQNPRLHHIFVPTASCMNKWIG